MTKQEMCTINATTTQKLTVIGDMDIDIKT